MPAKQIPERFPGAEHLPSPIQRLLQSIFPPDQLPIPLAGAELPPGGMGAATRRIYRGADDLSKVVPPPVGVPPPPPTTPTINGAFDEYLKRIQDLLRQR